MNIVYILKSARNRRTRYTQHRIKTVANDMKCNKETKYNKLW